MTNRQQATAERKHLHPAELEKVMTVYREFVYIPKDRKPERFIPIYKRNGTPIVEQVERGHYRPLMLHPENIYRPDMQPLPGDYIALAQANGEPSENHVEVFMTWETLPDGRYLVEPMDGEYLIVTRYPDLDTDARRAWKQVHP